MMEAETNVRVWWEDDSLHVGYPGHPAVPVIIRQDVAEFVPTGEHIDPYGLRELAKTAQSEGHPVADAFSYAADVLEGHVEPPSRAISRG